MCTDIHIYLLLFLFFGGRGLFGVHHNGCRNGLARDPRCPTEAIQSPFCGPKAASLTKRIFFYLHPISQSHILVSSDVAASSTETMWTVCVSKHYLLAWIQDIVLGIVMK